jgi:ribonuclease PH
MSLERDRPWDSLRNISFDRDALPHAEGSCIIHAGRTRVLCAATIQHSVPEWRRGSGAGWVTAEYSMLPRSTSQRTPRERGKVGGRTQEIQRLIGRALRATIDMSALGERTIIVDCDVLVADGGTRTASITGAALALSDACASLVRRGELDRSPMHQLVAAISVGLIEGEARLDLDYEEDVAADVDMNLVALENGHLVEVQGTAEGRPFDRAQLDRLIDLGLAGISRLIGMQHSALASRE